MATVALAATIPMMASAGAYVTNNSTISDNHVRSSTHTDLGVHGLTIDRAEGTVLRPGDDATLSFRVTPNPTGPVELPFDEGDAVTWTMTLPEQLDITGYEGGRVTSAYSWNWTQDGNTAAVTLTFNRATTSVPPQDITVDVTAVSEIPVGAEASVAITLPTHYTSAHASQSVIVPMPDGTVAGVHGLTFTPTTGNALRPDTGATGGILRFTSTPAGDDSGVLNLVPGDVVVTQIDLPGDLSLINGWLGNVPAGIDRQVAYVTSEGRFRITLTDTVLAEIAWSWSFSTTFGLAQNPQTLADGDPITVTMTLPERFDSAHLQAETFVPYITAGAIPFTDLAAGDNHVLALAEDGTLFAWGANTVGQLGTGDTTDNAVPTPVRTPDGVRFTSISAGRNWSLAVAEDGTLYSWGQPGTGSKKSIPTAVAIPGGAPIRQVLTGGGLVAFALSEAGDLFAWGNNYYGQSGIPEAGGSIAVPTRVDLPRPVEDIAADSTNAIVRLDDGTLLAWGANNYGELGIGVIGSQPAPVKVAVPGGHTLAGLWVAPVSGGFTDAGEAYWWGKAIDESLLPTPMPADIIGPGVVPVSVLSGQGQISVLSSGGTLYRASTPSLRFAGVPAPAHLHLTMAVGSLGNSSGLLIGLTPHGTAYAVGPNSSGQLGNGSPGAASTTFTPVTMPTVTSAADVRSSWSHDDITSDGVELDDSAKKDAESCPEPSTPETVEGSSAENDASADEEEDAASADEEENAPHGAPETHSGRAVQENKLDAGPVPCT